MQREERIVSQLSAAEKQASLFCLSYKFGSHLFCSSDDIQQNPKHSLLLDLNRFKATNLPLCTTKFLLNFLHLPLSPCVSPPLPREGLTTWPSEWGSTSSWTQSTTARLRLTQAQCTCFTYVVGTSAHTHIMGTHSWFRKWRVSASSILYLYLLYFVFNNVHELLCSLGRNWSGQIEERGDTNLSLFTFHLISSIWSENWDGCWFLSSLCAGLGGFLPFVHFDRAVSFLFCCWVISGWFVVCLIQFKLDSFDYVKSLSESIHFWISQVESEVLIVFVVLI